MLIRLYWSKCTLKRLETEPVDAFWVEATEKEAESLVFPYCSVSAIAESQGYGIRDREIALRLSNPSKPYCFLVARDLSTIEPFAVHYPYSPMWNAYSPFRKITERHLKTLEELLFLSDLELTVTTKESEPISLLV